MQVILDRLAEWIAAEGEPKVHFPPISLKKAAFVRAAWRRQAGSFLLRPSPAWLAG